MNWFFQKLKQLYQPFTVFALCFLIGYCFYNEAQRAKAIKEIRTFSTVNRRMLNARAKIQIMLINAQIENRRLTAEEIDTIGRLWAAAEYDQTGDVEVNEK